MKYIVYGLITLSTLSVCAEQKKSVVSAPSSEERVARRNKIVMERFGGYVTVKGTPAGSIVIVNAQKKVPQENFDILPSKGLRRIKDRIKVIEDEG